MPRSREDAPSQPAGPRIASRTSGPGKRRRPSLAPHQRRRSAVETVIESSPQIAGRQARDPSVHRTRARGGHAMSSRLRRSLVLTTLFALFLGVSGAAAPVGLAANPPNTKVAGIDVDATTIPQLQQLMNSHRINAVNLMNFYLHRIRQLNPVLNAVITVSPTAHADAVAADAARRGGDHRPLLGIPIIVKDNVGTAGM